MNGMMVTRARPRSGLCENKLEDLLEDLGSFLELLQPLSLHLLTLELVPLFQPFLPFHTFLGALCTLS